MVDMNSFFHQYWMLFIPLLIIQFGLMIGALIDLLRREQVVGGNKWLWGGIILFISYIGPILYFVIGRKES